MRTNLFVTVLLAASSAQAQMTKIVGLGASSCAHFNEEIARTPSTERDYFAWAQGFVPLQEQAAFLRKFCSNSPSQAYADAVIALYLRLRGPETRT